MPMTVIGSELSTAAVSVWAIEKLKNSALVPFLNKDSTTANRVAAGLASFSAASGMHLAFDHDTTAVTITFTIWGLFHFAGDWIQQQIFQEVVYNGAKVKNALKKP